jgi:hypothetical protein
MLVGWDINAGLLTAYHWQWEQRVHQQQLPMLLQLLLFGGGGAVRGSRCASGPLEVVTIWNDSCHHWQPFEVTVTITNDTWLPYATVKTMPQLLAACTDKTLC